MLAKRVRIAYPLVLLWAASMTFTVAQNTQGTISGHTYGPDGHALQGTTVWANIVSPLPRPVDRKSSIVLTLSTVTGADGAFTLYNVPAGEYILCASNPGAAALNPCPWGGAPRVSIISGANAANQAIHMAAGGILQVHLDDPSGLLAANAGKLGVGPLIALTTPQGFVPLSISGYTATSRDYKVLVPLNITYNLTISSTYFRLTDSSGTAVSGTRSIPITIVTGSAVQLITVNVVGIAN